MFDPNCWPLNRIEPNGISHNFWTKNYLSFKFLIFSSRLDYFLLSTRRRKKNSNETIEGPDDDSMVRFFHRITANLILRKV